MRWILTLTLTLTLMSGDHEQRGTIDARLRFHVGNEKLAFQCFYGMW